MRNRRRVLTGFRNINGLAYLYAKGLRELGYAATSYDGLNANRFGFPSDRCLPWFARTGSLGTAGRLLFLTWCLPRYDVYLFVWGSSFLPRNLDLPILRRLGKKVLANFCGCDIRQRDAHLTAGRRDSICVHCRVAARSCPFDQKRLLARNYERHANAVIAYPDNADLLTRPYHFYWRPIDADLYSPGVGLNETPMIVHAPSNEGKKGTDQIEGILEGLRKDGVAFTYLKLTGQPNTEVRKVLASADIVVDQLYQDRLNYLGLEAMASGCVAVGYLKRDVLEKLQDPAACPVVHADPSSLETVLRGLLLDRPRRLSLAAAGPQYVRRYHHYPVVAQRLSLIIEGTAEPDCVPPLLGRPAPAGGVSCIEAVPMEHGWP